MKYDSLRIRQRAKDNEKIIKDFLRKIKRNTPRNLDDLIKGKHEEVFEGTDCLSCANCCKTISPVIADSDVRRISSFLKMRPANFTETYLNLDEEDDYVLREAPCPFLLESNECFIYEVRPKACRDYPHTDRRRFHQILDLTLKNTYVCPAVLEIILKLKKELV